MSDGSSNCSSKVIPPSKNCSSKTRRHRGEGSGHIYYRTVTRSGKEYQQVYSQWRENGKQRTKYIPKKLLTRVEEAESKKFPIADVLVLLGGMDKCSSTDKLHNDKSSDTLNSSSNEQVENICEAVSFRTSIAPIEEKVSNTSINCSSKVAPPSKRRRAKGKGSGWIECKPIKRSGKEYKQYWYHYEEWREGDRVTKKSKYISKRMRSQIERMNNDKVSVEEILRVLKGESKRT